MTYLTFHIRFIVPLILLLWLLLPHTGRRERFARLGIITISLIAFAYATPWDNWLVANAIWTYGADRVLMTIGYVPIEEYLFFILQPILTGLWLYHMSTLYEPRWFAKQRTSVRVSGAVVFGIITLLSAALLLAPPSYRYLAMILVWAAPVLALHWAVGGDQLVRNWRVALAGIIPPTLYLGVVDRFAIGAGVWHITTATSTQIMVFGLPIEELIFFAVTNIMVVQGLLLFAWVAETGAWERFVQQVYAVARRALSLDAPLRPPEPARDTINRHIVMPSRWVLGAVAVLFLLPVDVPLTVQFIPLLLSAVLLGLPHGAVDHIVPGMVNGRPLTRRALLGLLGAYVLPIGVMLGVWFVFPLAGFVFFILLTWFHWGLGDLHAVLSFGSGDVLRSPAQRVQAALVRGALPMMVPLVFFPADYALALEGIVASFSAVPVANPLPWLFGVPFRVGLGLALLGVIAFDAASTYQPTRAWRSYVGETALLAAYFAVVPPFLAVGLYFCLWHAVRHIARLLLLDERATEQLAQGRTHAALGRFYRLALPMTGLALVILGGLYAVVPVRPTDALGAVGLYLALIAALTVPHTLIVLWLDAVQQVWHPERTHAPVLEPERAPTG